MRDYGSYADARPARRGFQRPLAEGSRRGVAAFVAVAVADNLVAFRAVLRQGPLVDDRSVQWGKRG